MLSAQAELIPDPINMNGENPFTSEEKQVHLFSGLAGREHLTTNHISLHCETISADSCKCYTERQVLIQKICALQKPLMQYSKNQGVAHFGGNSKLTEFEIVGTLLRIFTKLCQFCPIGLLNIYMNIIHIFIQICYSFCSELKVVKRK